MYGWRRSPARLGPPREGPFESVIAKTTKFLSPTVTSCCVHGASSRKPRRKSLTSLTKPLSSPQLGVISVAMHAAEMPRLAYEWMSTSGNAEHQVMALTRTFRNSCR